MRSLRIDTFTVLMSCYMFVSPFFVSVGFAVANSLWAFFLFLLSLFYLGARCGRSG